MKKLLQILAVPAFALAVVVSASSYASALPVDCENISITNTGPGSTNVINCEDETTVTITCDNDTVINIDTTQDANSGVSIVNGNTNAGSAITGGANNVLDTIVEVDNACVLAAAVTPEPETPVTPVTPVTPQETQPTVTPKAKTLPYTGQMTAFEKLSITLAAIIALAIVARVSVGLYSKYSSN